MRCYSCLDEHLIEYQKARKIKRETPQHLDQRIYMTFNMNIQIPIEMLWDIKTGKRSKIE